MKTVISFLLKDVDHCLAKPRQGNIQSRTGNNDGINLSTKSM